MQSNFDFSKQKINKSIQREHVLFFLLLVKKKQLHACMVMIVSIDFDSDLATVYVKIMKINVIYQQTIYVSAMYCIFESSANIP